MTLAPDPPARPAATPTWPEGAVALAGVAPFALLPFLSPPWTGFIAGLASLLAGFAVLRGCPQAAAGFLLTGTVFAAVACPALAGLWPLPLLLGLGADLALTLMVPSLRKNRPWPGPGRLGWREGAWIAAIGLAAGAALVVWRLAAAPDLSDLQARIPRWPPVALAGLALLFALANAVAEEAVYRGVLMEILERVLGRGALAWALQAALFGLLHLHGFPRGWSGVLLASLYGGMLGALRRFSGGLAAPVLAHVLADLVIFAMLAGFAS